MKWYINKSNPICPQVYEQICVAIKNGEFKPNDKIYSVRELSLLIGVTPNTIQKSYELLCEEGVIYSVRGSGWFVSEKTNRALEVVDSIKEKKVKEFLEKMLQIGVSEKEALSYLEERIKK